MGTLSGPSEASADHPPRLAGKEGTGKGMTGEGMTGELVTAEDVGWFRIDDAGTAGIARRAATEAGQLLGLDESRLGELAIAVAEMTSNLNKHADEGSILVRRLRHGGVGGVALIALDAGPGMPDRVRSGRDGHSTAGTLGIGLGAIERLATHCEGYSQPGRGTVLAAEFWPDRARSPVARSPATGLTRPITGESVSGDEFAIRPIPDGVLLMLSDGLGHGPLASAASAAAAESFLTDTAQAPAAILDRMHKRIGHTRGAAVGIAAVNRVAGTVRYAGLGNIAAYVVRLGERRTMVSLPGIVGHQRRTVREFDHPLASDAVVVLHSDGLTDRWNLDDYPDLLGQGPVLIAATLLRDAGQRRDDAGVLVAARQ